LIGFFLILYGAGHLVTTTFVQPTIWHAILAQFLTPLAKVFLFTAGRNPLEGFLQIHFQGVFFLNVLNLHHIIALVFTAIYKLAFRRNTY